jgi:hypothetical protein
MFGISFLTITAPQYFTVVVHNGITMVVVHNVKLMVVAPLFSSGRRLLPIKESHNRGQWSF